MWNARLAGEFNSSPVLVGSLVDATNESGETYLFEATPEGYRAAGKNQLGAECFATPVICGGKIYFQIAITNDGPRQEKLACIGEG